MRLLILAILHVMSSVIEAADLYHIESQDEDGKLSLKARKEYHFWTNANRTYYELKLESSKPIYPDELRIAIQWLDTQERSEEVVFYGN